MCTRGRLARKSHVSPQLLGALSHRLQADTVVGVPVEPDAVVDDVDIDRVAGRDRQPAACRPRMAEHVRHSPRSRSGTSPPRPQPAVRSARSATTCGSRLLVAGAGELRDRADQSELIECGWHEVTHDPLDSLRDRVDLVGETFEQLARGRQRSPASPRSICRNAVRRPSETPVERGTEAVVEVAPQPAALLLPRRHDGDARPSQVGGEAHPADRQPQRTDELRQHVLVAARSDRAVLPADHEPSDDLAVLVELDGSRVRRLGAERRLPPPTGGPCVSLTSMATKSSRRSRCRLAASAGSSSSPESAPTCSTTPRTTSSGSSRAPQTSRSADALMRRRTGSASDGDDRAVATSDSDRRSVAAAETSATPADDPGVHDEDRAREQQPTDHLVGDAVEPSRPIAQGVDDRGDDEQRHRRHAAAAGRPASPSGALISELEALRERRRATRPSAPAATTAGSGSSESARCRPPQRRSTMRGRRRRQRDEPVQRVDSGMPELAPPRRRRRAAIKAAVIHQITSIDGPSTRAGELPRQQRRKHPGRDRVGPVPAPGRGCAQTLLGVVRVGVAAPASTTASTSAARRPRSGSRPTGDGRSAVTSAAPIRCRSTPMTSHATIHQFSRRACTSSLG